MDCPNELSIKLCGCSVKKIVSEQKREQLIEKKGWLAG